MLSRYLLEGKENQSEKLELGDCVPWVKTVSELLGGSICLAKVMPASCSLWCMCAYMHNAILLPVLALPTQSTPSPI